LLPHLHSLELDLLQLHLVIVLLHLRLPPVILRAVPQLLLVVLDQLGLLRLLLPEERLLAQNSRRV